MPDTLTVPFDEDILLVTSMTSQEFVSTAKFTVAAKLWMDGRQYADTLACFYWGGLMLS